MDEDKPLTFYNKAALAGISGAIAGFVGTPADVVNVRMQYDIKLPIQERRNYNHAFDGVAKIVKSEGALSLFHGASMASSRGLLMSVGTLSVYDQTKETLILHNIVHNYVLLHLCASCYAAFATTLLVHPLDVIKTRLMNATPGQYHG
uniref:Mitochondrial dicarboxylate carrier n=1 Tax=Acrobeloides nanus TaxID=290746 RepID=A0A914C084_9BILA